MTSPRVSIIVPSYNHSAFVTTLIESIYNQTFKDFELIVLDDGSKDNSVQILNGLKEKHNFEFIAKNNEGLCKTLNLGISKARGEFIVIIASDDFMPPTRLAEQVSFFDAHPDVEVLGGAMYLVDNDGALKGSRIPAIQGYVTFKEMLKINRVLTASVMVRAEIYKKYGLYNPDHVFEDYPMWLKVLKNGGRIFNSDKFWAYYRISTPDLEKKFNWYFSGSSQALQDYGSYPGIKKYIARHRFTFLMKIFLLLGLNGRSKYFHIYRDSSMIEKGILIAVGVLPRNLRLVFMKKMKLTI